VFFTGSTTDSSGNEIDRADLEALAERNGIVAKDSVTAEGCGLLVAADVSAPLNDFLQSVGTNATTARHPSRALWYPLVCVSCGDSWIASVAAANRAA
jgi:DNA polymerase-3 subunit epsilon